MYTLLHKCMISGMLSAIIVLPLLILSYNTNYTNEALAWATMIVAIEAGIVIAFIVDDKANQSHNEVMNAQIQIQTLLGRLDETDQKHKEALDVLRDTQETNEKLATQSIRSSLEYITIMMEKLIKIIKIEAIEPDDKKLISEVLNHLESPLNLIIQAIPQTGSKLKNEKDELMSEVETLRTLVITSLVVSDDNTKRTFVAIKTNYENLKKIIEKIKIDNK